MEQDRALDSLVLALARWLEAAQAGDDETVRLEALEDAQDHLAYYRGRRRRDGHTRGGRQG